MSKKRGTAIITPIIVLQLSRLAFVTVGVIKNEDTFAPRGCCGDRLEETRKGGGFFGNRGAF